MYKNISKNNQQTSHSVDAFESTLNANFNEHTRRYAYYANAHLI